MDSSTPDSGLSPMMASAVATHEQYRAYCKAGFTRFQAFTLVRDMLHDFRLINAHSECGD